MTPSRDPGERFELLYTGSRLITDQAAVYRDLDRVLGRHPALLLRHGKCNRGGDLFAARWAAQRRAEGRDIEVEGWAAPWTELGLIAGPMRNGFLAGLTWPAAQGGRGGGLAHQQPGSTGSAGCAAFAKTVGIPVWEMPA
jgi:SLOG family YspA-like protein